MQMVHYPCLMRRRERWFYVRTKVPVDLIPFLGRREVWRSLKTADHREAVRRYHPALAKLGQEFEDARRRRDAGDRLNGEMPRLVLDWFRRSEQAHADFDLTGEALRDAIGETEQLLYELTADGAEEDVSAVIDRVLIDAGWPARRHAVGSIKTRRMVADGEVPSSLHGLVRRALIESARRRLDRLQGQPARPVDTLFNGAAVHPVAQDDQTGLTLAELIEQFETETTPRIGFSKRVEYQALFRALRDVWGDHKPIREVTRADCRAVRDLFAGLPPNSMKRWPRLTLAQAAERAKREGLSTLSIGTVNGYMAKLSTMLRWATREEFVDRNPAEALQVAQPGNPRDARRPFSIGQLNLIFAAPPFVPRDDHGATFWAPLISLYGGLRLGEICQLGTEDVTERDGVPVILVRPDPNGGRLKTKAARRTVPVHPELARIGLLKFVAKQRDDGHDRLFPELHTDHRGYRTDALQRRVNRQIDRAGAKGDRQSFHSLRHTWRDALREADVSRDATLAMGGWKSGGTEEIYGGGLRASTLTREIAKLRYPGLELGRLYLGRSGEPPRL